MVKRIPAEPISALASVTDTEKHRNVMLALGLIKINKRGSYETTDLGARFLREYHEVHEGPTSPYLQTGIKILEEFLGKSLKENIRKRRLVAHVKTSAKIGDLIDLADRVIRESREIERTLRKKGTGEA
jgi:hypothetical protein